MTYTVTAEMLRKHRACRAQRYLFAQTFPDGMPVTLRNLAEAIRAGLDVGWGVGMLPAPARAEYDKAIADYTQALRYDPKLAIAYMNRAIAYRLKGENDRSITEFTKLLRDMERSAQRDKRKGRR